MCPQLPDSSLSNTDLSTEIKQDRRWNADKPSATLDP